mgnify:CR=1 FL=1
MSEQRIGPKGLALVKAFEGCVLYPYDDLIPSRKGVYREWMGEALRGTATVGVRHGDHSSLSSLSRREARAR